MNIMVKCEGCGTEIKAHTCYDAVICMGGCDAMTKITHPIKTIEGRNYNRLTLEALTDGNN